MSDASGETGAAREGTDPDPVQPVQPTAQPPIDATALPRSAYIWLGLLLVGILCGSLWERLNPAPTEPALPALTSSEWDSVVQVERSIRAALAIGATRRQAGDAPDTTEQTLKQQQEKLLQDAVREYRRLARKTSRPNATRKVLILEHLLQKPLDDALLERTLAADLKADNTAPEDIQAEIRFWRALYGDASTRAGQAETVLAAGETRIREMQLGTLEDRALIDFYQASGDSERAARLQRQFDGEMADWRTRNLAAIAVGVTAFLTGLFVLIRTVTGFARSREKLSLIQNGPPAAEGMALTETAFGPLVDSFLAYLAINEIVQLLARLAAEPILARLTSTGIVVFTAGIYVAPVLMAAAYLQGSLRRQGLTWAAIGITTGKRFWADVRFGVLGWCAALPLVAGLGVLSRLFFRDNPNTVPNPVLPMIATETDPAGQLMIFLLAAVAAPLCEELFFRGALLTGLKARYGGVLAVVFSALLFAVVHPMQDWLPILGLGLVLGYLRVTRGNLVPSITAHSCQNAMTFFFLSILFSGE